MDLSIAHELGSEKKMHSCTIPAVRCLNTRMQDEKGGAGPKDLGFAIPFPGSTKGNHVVFACHHAAAARGAPKEIGAGYLLIDRRR